MITQEHKDLILMRLARLKTLLAELAQHPEISKRTVTSTDRARYRLMTALEVVSQGLSDKGIPSAEAVRTALDACWELGAVVLWMPPDARLANRDWTNIAPALATEFDDLADALDQAKPEDRAGVVQRIAGRLWTLVDEQSVRESRYKNPGEETLADAERAYEKARANLELINGRNIAAGRVINPRETGEAQDELMRQTAHLRQVRARHGILS